MKVKIIKIIIYFLSIPVFIVLSFIASMATYGAVVGDPCEYHTIDDKELSFLFKLFYPMTSTSGYHPEPGWFNGIFALCVGVLLGIIVSRFFIKIIFKKNKNEVSEVLDK